MPFAGHFFGNTMKIINRITLVLFSAATTICSAQTTNDVHIGKAKQYEAIAKVYLDAAEIANNAIMNLESIAPSTPSAKQPVLDEAGKTEKIANLHKQMYLDYLDVCANYLIAKTFYEKTGKKELIEGAEKEVKKVFNLALMELSASGEAYSSAADHFENDKQAEKAIELKRKQAEILKILAKETQTYKGKPAPEPPINPSK
jgi:hypothetical protein